MTALICITNVSVYPKPSVVENPLTRRPFGKTDSSTNNFSLSDILAFDENSFIPADAVIAFVHDINDKISYKGVAYMWVEIDLSKAFYERDAFDFDRKVSVGYISRLRVLPGPGYKSIDEKITKNADLKDWITIYS